MNIKHLTTIALAAAAVSTGRAQNVATPSTPAPSVAPAPQQQAAAPTPAPTQIVYRPRLPTAADLTNAAAAQGVTVERIEQNAAQVVAVYRLANGQTNTVSYQVLPPTGVPTAQPTQTGVAPAVTYVEAPPPRVVYVEDYYGPAYYRPYYYPPVSLSLGFGFRGGYYHGGYGYRGGFHHR